MTMSARAQDIAVAPESPGTSYPPHYFAYPTPAKSAPFDTSRVSNPEQKAVYERWNAWLSNPYRPPYLLGDEPFRLGLQVKQYDYKTMNKKNAEKNALPLNAGGIGKVSGKPAKGRKDNSPAPKNGSSDVGTTSGGGIGKVGGNIGKVGPSRPQ